MILKSMPLDYIFFFRGLLGLNNHRANILFSERAGHRVCGEVMSRERFKFLVAHIAFDEENTRERGWKEDGFAAFRQVFEEFNNNCSKNLVPSEYLSLDETLYPMRNQINFRQYHPNKPAKYGVLFKSINDLRFSYTYRSDMYDGKRVNGAGPYFVKGTEIMWKPLWQNWKKKPLYKE